MQKCKLILLSCFIFNALFSQIGYDFDIIEDINQDLYDFAYKSFCWDDGVLVLGICNNEHYTQEGMTLAYYDTTGNKLWDKIVLKSDKYIIQGNDIYFDGDSAFYVTGLIYSDTISRHDIFVSKHDRDGNVIFAEIYPDIEYNYPYNISLYSQDTLLICSNVKDDANSIYSSICFTKVDKQGNFVSQKVLPRTLYSGKQMIIDNDRIYVGGYRRTSETSTYHIKVFVYVYNMLFHQIDYWNPAIPTNDIMENMVLVDDYMYISSVGSASGYSGFEQARVTKYNLNGDKIKSEAIGPVDRRFTIGNTLTNGQNLVMIIDSLYFLDLDLNLVCSSSYSATLQCYYSFIWNYTLSPSNKIIGAGYYQETDSYNSTDSWLFMTNSVSDYIEDNCNMSIEVDVYNTQRYSLFPSIFDTKLEIIDNSPGLEKSKLLMYNSVGQIVYEDSFIDNTLLNVQNLSTGVYILIIMSESKKYNYKVIKSN